MMNALIYTENSQLIIRKPNGLEWDYENVDAPELGWEYDVLVYDDIEVCIENYDHSKSWDEQDKRSLSPAEKERIVVLLNSPDPKPSAL